VSAAEQPRWALRAVCLAAALAAAPPLAAAAPSPAEPPAPADRLEGPLRLNDLFLLNVGTFGYEPPPARLLARGRWSLGFSLASANTFTRSESVQVALETRGERAPVDRGFFDRVEETKVLDDTLFLLDGEVSVAAVRLRRGLPRGWEVEVTVPYLTIGGGILDGPTETFHDAAGLDLDGRQSVPRGRYLLFLGDPAHEVWRSSRPGNSLGDVRLAARKRLELRSSRYSLVVDGSVKLPTGDDGDLMSTGSGDLAVQALLTRCGRRSCLHAGAGLRRVGEWEALSLPARSLTGGLVGWERAWGERLSLALHLLYAESPYGGTAYATLRADVFQLTGGVRYRTGPHQSLWLGVVENVVHFENGADIALHLGIEWGFGSD